MRSLGLSIPALVAVNLLPIVGVLLFDWAVFEILFLFWAENLIIGGFNVARMVSVLRREKRRSMIFFIPFFCVHYGIFTLAHLVFLLALFMPESSDASSTGPIVFLALLGLVVSHGLSFFQNFIGRAEYRHISDQALMTAPYGRLMIMHITILAGGFLIMSLGEPVYALILLVVLKILIDVQLHVRSHRNKHEQEE